MTMVLAPGKPKAKAAVPLKPSTEGEKEPAAKPEEKPVEKAAVAEAVKE